MQAQRHVRNFWDPRAQDRQSQLKLLPNPMLFSKPPDAAWAFVNDFQRKTYDFGPKLTLLPKPAPKSVRAHKEARMEKVTSVERELMTQERIEMSKRSGEWGYMQKLVKRGLYRQVSTQGYVVTFQKISPREQAGRELSALIKAKWVLRPIPA